MGLKSLLCVPTKSRTVCRERVKRFVQYRKEALFEFRFELSIPFHKSLPSLPDLRQRHFPFFGNYRRQLWPISDENERCAKTLQQPVRRNDHFMSGAGCLLREHISGEKWLRAMYSCWNVFYDGNRAHSTCFVDTVALCILSHWTKGEIAGPQSSLVKHHTGCWLMTLPPAGTVGQNMSDKRNHEDHHWYAQTSRLDGVFPHAPWRHAYILIRNSRAHSEVRPVVRGFTSHCQWQRAVSLFLSARQLAHACTTERKKKKEPIARLKQREKLRSKGKSCTNTNSCNPKVNVTDKSSKEGSKRPVSSTYWRLAKLCSLRAVEGRVCRRLYTPFGESNMHQFSKQGVPERFIMATSGNKSFESTKIDSGRPSNTTVDGCLAGRRLLCGRQKKKNLPSLSQRKWRSWENLSNRFSLFLGVLQIILALFKSVYNASCRGMSQWEQQSKPSDLGWTGLDLTGPARILVLDCLFLPLLAQTVCWVNSSFIEVSFVSHCSNLTGNQAANSLVFRTRFCTMNDYI